jgi:hypothetical protein
MHRTPCMRLLLNGARRFTLSSPTAAATLHVVYTPRARLSKYIVKNKGMTLVKVITGGPSSPEAAARAHPKRITAGF